METKVSAVTVVLLTTLLTSTAQILYKLGIGDVTWSPKSILTNEYMVGGMVLYAVGGILIILALRGGEVSVLYPLIATSYIWVSFFSVRFLRESMNVWKWLGVITIVVGIALIGFGSREPTPGVI